MPLEKDIISVLLLPEGTTAVPLVNVALIVQSKTSSLKKKLYFAGSKRNSFTVIREKYSTIVR